MLDSKRLVRWDSINVHPETRQIAEYMLDFGLHLLARAILDVTFAEIQNPYSHAMAVVRCAHAAEIILKAKIAEEHPLLIFTKLPRPDPTSNGPLNIRTLLTDPRSRTLTYSELPDALWAATGYRIENLKRFEEFGRLRNTITHLGIPGGEDFVEETYRFAYEIIVPMIRHFWGVGFAEYFSAYEEEGAEYVQQMLDKYGL